MPRSPTSVSRLTGVPEDLRVTLVHHEHQLGALTNDVLEIKKGLSDQYSILGAIRDKLTEQLSIRHVSTMDIMRTTALGGSIVAMTSAAITYLVLSVVNPVLSEIKFTANFREARLSALEQIQDSGDKELRVYYRELLQKSIESRGTTP